METECTVITPLASARRVKVCWWVARVYLFILERKRPRTFDLPVDRHRSDRDDLFSRTFPLRLIFIAVELLRSYVLYGGVGPLGGI